MNQSSIDAAGAATVDESVDGPGSKRTWVLGGIAAGLAVVAVMAYVLLSGGGDAVSPAVAAPKAKATPAAEPSAAASAPAIKKYTGKNAKDPFKALVVEPVGSSGGSSTASSSGSGAGAGTSTGSTSTSGTGTTTTTSTVPTASPTATPAPKSVDPVTITLVSVASGDTSASFTLDTKAYRSVKPQATFGTYFKLLNLTEGKCGAVQYGDVTFEMCEGDSLTLR